MLRKLGTNVLSNWTGLALSMAVAFFMSPFLVHSLGDAQYGVWILILSLTGYMGLLDAGLKVSVVKYVSRQHAVSDIAGLGKTVSTALVIYGLLAILLIALAATVGRFLDDIVTVPTDLASTAQTLLIVASGSLALALIASVFGGFVAGFQRYDISNGIGMAVSLAASAAIYGVISSGFGIVHMGLVQVAAQVLSGALLLWAVIRLQPGLSIGLSQVSSGVAKDLYGYSAFVLLNNLAMLLLFRSGELLAGAKLGAIAVTYFAIGGSLAEYLGKIIGTMTQVLHPYASAQHARGDTSGLRAALIKGTRACLAIALPACVVLALAGKAFIGAWMGPKYAVVSGPILLVLSLGRVFWLSQSAAGNILLGAGRHKQLALFAVATGIAGLVLAILLTDRMGLLGIATGLSITLFVSHGLLMPIYVCRTWNIRSRDYLRGAVLGPVLATLPFSLVLGATFGFFSPKSIGQIVLAIALAVPVFVVTAYYSCIEKDGREKLQTLVKEWRSER